MKKNDLRNALSGINKEYLSESDDFKTVSADFRKQKTFKIKAITTTLCLAFVGVGAIGITQSGLLNRKLQTLDEEISTVSSAESTSIPVLPICLYYTPGRSALYYILHLEIQSDHYGSPVL